MSTLPLTPKQIAGRAYRQRHQVRIRAYKRRYDRTHRAKLRLRSRAYYQTHTVQRQAHNLQASIARGETLPPGQYLAHCGTWQRLEALPHTCTRCSRRFFEEEPTP